MSVTARYMPRKNNILANRQSHPRKIFPREWPLFSQVYDVIFEVYSQPQEQMENHLCICHQFQFIYRGSRMPTNISGTICVYAFPPICYSHPSFVKSPFDQSLNDPVSTILASKRVGCRSSISLGEKPLKLPMLWDLLVQSHIRKFRRCLASLQLQLLKLLDTCLQGRIFEKGWLQMSYSVISVGLQQMSIGERGQDSSIGVVDRLSIHERPSFSR